MTDFPNDNLHRVSHVGIVAAIGDDTGSGPRTAAAHDVRRRHFQGV